MSTAILKEYVQEPVIFAHEIRSPLTAINFALAVLQQKSDDSSLNMYFDIIVQNSQRINTLVTDLLLSGRKDKALRSGHSLNHILDESLEMAKDRILLKKIKIHTRYADELCNITVDFSKIKIAFLNIIVNAIEAMPAETGKLELITVAAGNKCSVIIRDNGIGMSKEVIANIFKPYYSGKENGLGVGLSNTLSILQANNATIDAASAEGKGSCFTVTFNTVNIQRKH